MFRVEDAAGTLESILLEDTDARARVKIAPTRGGLITSFSVGDESLLYLDEATLRDPDKNVRGGIPVLFPTPGKLAGDAWSHAGHSGKLPQHGFARNLAWEVGQAGSDGAASVTLRLASGEATRTLWPWSFVLEHRISLRARTLRIDQRVENRGGAPMPFGLGFHPYFWLRDAEKSGARVETRATRAWDNVAKREIALDSIALAGREVDLHLLDHGSSRSALVGGARRIDIRASEEYQRFVIWTLPGKDFVCLEPWTSPGNALNAGTGLLELAPGACRNLFVEFEAAGA